ncbi:MAG: DUF1949 domain-containing protein [Lachnospira eligens]
MWEMQYICAQNDITIVNTEYADGVTFELMMENAARNVLEKNMTEMSSGKICKGYMQHADVQNNLRKIVQMIPQI